jgi:Fic family protein
MSEWIWQRKEWPHFFWDEAAIATPLARARLAHGRVLGAVGILDPALTREAYAAFLVGEGVATSAIEGEKLSVNAVRSSVARHLGLPSAGLPAPTRSVDGLVDVMLDATRAHAAPLTVERLCRWQAALFPTGQSGLRRIRTGSLRGSAPMRVVSERAGRERVHFVAPPRERLHSELRRFLKWFTDPPSGLDGLLRAGLTHFWFVSLHPFEDGNGRIARALTDMALAQDERQPQRFFSLSARIEQEREAYYAILEKTQRGALDVTAWLCWFLEQTEAACEIAETTVSHVLAKARYWLRFQGTNLNDRQRKVLNRLLDAGPDGFEGGLTTRKYGSLTRVSRATAYRELADLVEKRCLEPFGPGGRSSAYAIRWTA